jgi:hypothetical protein
MEVGVRELRNHVYQILLNRAPASRRCTLHCRTGERRPAAHTGDYLAAYETVVGGTVDASSDRLMMLVLDNCEYVTAAISSLVEEVLTMLPAVRIWPAAAGCRRFPPSGHRRP